MKCLSHGHWRWLTCALRCVCLAAPLLGLTACAVSKIAQEPHAIRQATDPWESWNRKVFGFNESLDRHLLKPVATVYTELIPGPVRQATSNFFGNVGDAWSAFNLVLQGRFKPGAEQTMRFAMNSTFGLAGLIDIATPAGIERRREDLGRTFGHWGFGSGPYIVWPLLGPSSLRDSFALPLDRRISPALLVSDRQSQWALYGLQAIDERANLLRAAELLDAMALDKYSFIRDAYLQRRGNLEEDDGDSGKIPPLDDERP
jgi:phospholipid-binding lipoprotein MlaA